VLALLVLTAALRMGVAPLHGWVPALVQRGPAGLAALLTGGQVSLLLFTRLFPPLAPLAWGRGQTALAVLGLFSVVYGALLALAQSDLKRTLSFLLVSQHGMMLVGLSVANTPSVAGALLHGLACALPMGGLLLVVEALEARTGTTEMYKLGALARKGPRLATCFFLLAFASLGFPGSLSFVGEDLLIQGALLAHPVGALPFLLATALNGVTFLRVFLKTFAGPPGPASSLPADLLPRERLTAVALLALTLLAGGYPHPLLSLRASTVERFVSLARP
jgi:NADH-quinone oxidoreductase subunit M